MKGDYMIKGFALIMRFVVIGIIYIVLFRIIRIMYLDLKGINKKGDDSMNYALEVEDTPSGIGVNKGSVIPVHSITNIGRKEDNHVILNDAFVSGHHARVFIKNKKLYIKDLESTNGTIHNGSKVEGTEELYKGDVVEIGRIILRVIG